MPNNSNNDNKKTLYILLTKTNTLFSSLIQSTTNASFTHAAISLDRNLNQLYSFSRLFSTIPFIARFMQENVHNGVYARNCNIPAAVYELQVDSAVYNAVKLRINKMLAEQKRYRYNIIGLVYNFLGQTYSRPYHYFCSEFVIDTLIKSGAICTNRQPCSVRPADFTSMPELRLVYSGAIENCDALCPQIPTDSQKMPLTA